jgi:O-antigen/teichoic acid export membrane protein
MFLSKYGTLTDVGYFEIASRIVSQLRGVVVGAMQSIIPKVAIISKSSDNTRMASIHTILFRMNNFMVFAFLGACVIFAPLLSQIFLKKIDNEFIMFLLCLSIAWGINSVNIPAYLINLGTGKIKGNLWSHIIVGILNILLCLLGGYFMGAWGVFIGFCTALVIGSSYILTEFCVRYEYNVSNEFINIILIVPFLLLFVFYFFLSSFTNILFLILCFSLFLLTICYFNRNEVFVDKVRSLLKL